ncbi:hypothetical protein ROA7023_04307 [Roseisalinus antarcticus]|uniref:Uncharacterized protein n=1 Tax=Roseisalinus antarcticus TaxID=254357 RepID=A0A1Y5U4V8_9RHOB|nr:hypothetical protein ROA7023_04307 [Roseisalinus antarcticus]
MIRLNLTAAPEWLELAPGLRLQVAPLTTALMVSARADAALEALPEDASQEELALVMAKSVARRAVLDWEGVGDAMGQPTPVSPDGIDALLEIWPVFEAFQTQYVARGLLSDAEKKRLRALAEWSFGGGDSYCTACEPYEGRERNCADCPARLNQPQTQDGWQVWDLVGRLGGQLRVIPGAVLGWDMGAAIALAQALGIDTLIAAELLPEIEAVMVRKLNEQMEGSRDG